MHDYLKFIKFGYGRASARASKDIRGGHMSSREGIEMVSKYDHVRSSDLYQWHDYVGRDEAWFDTISNSFREPRAWVQDSQKNWLKRNFWD